MSVARTAGITVKDKPTKIIIGLDDVWFTLWAVSSVLKASIC